MSFILDALKKSETERQRRTGPGFATIAGASQRKSLPTWAIAIGGLLLINLVVVLAVALWPDQPQPQVSVTPTAQPATGKQSLPIPATQRDTNPGRSATTQDTTTTDRPEVRSLAGEVEEPAAESGNNAARSSRGTNTGTTGGTVTTSQTNLDSNPQRGGFVVYQTTDPTVPATDLPTLSDLRSQGLLSIPDLHMDIHVYGDTEADRFVFINMRKYTKDDTLREGPVVEQIVHDGVILRERGLRFFLPSD